MKVIFIEIKCLFIFRVDEYLNIFLIIIIKKSKSYIFIKIYLLYFIYIVLELESYCLKIYFWFGNNKIIVLGWLYLFDYNKVVFFEEVDYLVFKFFCWVRFILFI